MSNSNKSAADQISDGNASTLLIESDDFSVGESKKRHSIHQSTSNKSIRGFVHLPPLDLFDGKITEKPTGFLRRPTVLLKAN